jgi:hypothetical protein
MEIGETHSAASEAVAAKRPPTPSQVKYAFSDKKTGRNANRLNKLGNP